MYSTTKKILFVIVLVVLVVGVVRFPGMRERYRWTQNLCKSATEDPQAGFYCRDKWQIIIFGYPEDV